MPLPKGEKKPPGAGGLEFKGLDPQLILDFKDQCIRNKLNMVQVFRVMFRVYCLCPGDFAVIPRGVRPPREHANTLALRWVKRETVNLFKSVCYRRGLMMVQVAEMMMRRFVADASWVLDELRSGDFRRVRYHRR